MKTLLLTLAAKAVPIFALIFVTALLAIKIYTTVRSRYNIKVNCWFCNKNTQVPYPEKNSWNCPYCEQYNGFKDDGDYNRDILAQWYSNASRGSSKGNLCANAYYSNSVANPQQLNNGLCDQCNESQRLKIEKLAQFEPRHESRFSQELKQYQSELEKKYRLCGTCERHVNKVLHEKKKMVIGSKLLNFLFKGAALLKKPYYDRLAHAQRQSRLIRYQILMTLLTQLNILCLLSSLPVATREQFNSLLGTTLAHPLYFVYSHALTLLRLLIDYVSNLMTSQAYIAQILLFAQTIGKLVAYSVGVGQHVTFSSCYISLYHYAMLTLSFICNISDGLKFTRFTTLLLLWSVNAKIDVLLGEAIDGSNVMLLGSVVTLILLTRKRLSWSLQSEHNESVEESFHRLCADECISDDETISMLSQQLSYNANSSNNSNHNYDNNCQASSTIDADLRQRQTNNRSSVLSLDSLRLSSQRSPLDMAPLNYGSQASIYGAGSLDPHSWRSSYVMHPCDVMQMSQQNSNWRNLAPSPTLQQNNFGHEQRPLTRSTNNLLFPSRLQTHQQHHQQQYHQQQQQQRNGDICAWVHATSDNQHPELLQEPTTANLMGCCYNREMSRTSSQSSGIESQLGNNPARQEMRSPPHLLSIPSLPTQQQVHLQHPLPRDCGRPDAQRLLRVPPPLLTPYSIRSETPHLRRTLTGPAPLDLRPGDLLRNWMDKNGVPIQKDNR